MRLFFLLFLSAWLLTACQPQPEKKLPDTAFIQKIFDESLNSGQAFAVLRHLCKEIGPRLSGSPQSYEAIAFGDSLFRSLGLDTVMLQPCMVRYWKRGPKESASVIGSDSLGTFPLRIAALGGSVATPAGGIRAPLIEVKDFDALEKMGRDSVQGKIVFFNRSMQSNLLETFRAYGGAVAQRSQGASVAAKYGAAAALVRSMTLAKDAYPHTGAMVYDTAYPKIPAAALSTLDAELLSALIRKEGEVTVRFQQQCEIRPDTLSYNVVGEWRGKTQPDNILLVGGHLDSWDLAEGAHDDGTGVAQAYEALRLLKKLGYTPNHTLRVVWFMNEENGLGGAKAYADSALSQKKKHVVAIESDAGGFTPRGFSISANPEQLAVFRTWQPLLAPFGFVEFNEGGGGSDIAPLGKQGAALVGYLPDSQRYFDYHHAATDVLEAVNERELQLGAAGIAALIYLLDQYGL
jgi:hypothetical protein